VAFAESELVNVKLRLNQFYNNIIAALSSAAKSTVPMAKQNFFKFWWDEMCQALKDESIAKHRSWVAAGRPRDGPVAGAMRKAKYDYKMYLKRQRSEERKCFTNDLHDALIDKDFGSFWKTWNGKFGSKFNSQVINGVSSHSGIAEVFGNIYARESKTGQ